MQRDIIHTVKMGMEIEEVNDEHLYGGYQQVAAEMVVGLRQPRFHHLEVPTTQFSLSGIQFHDGITEQSQLTFHAIIAERRG